MAEDRDFLERAEDVAVPVCWEALVGEDFDLCGRHAPVRQSHSLRVDRHAPEPDVAGRRAPRNPLRVERVTPRDVRGEVRVPARNDRPVRAALPEPDPPRAVRDGEGDRRRPSARREVQGNLR